MTENEAALYAAHDVFTEAWRFYRRCLSYGLERRSPSAFAKAADDMGETYAKFRGTGAEALAGDILGAVYTSFDRTRKENH